MDNILPKRVVHEYRRRDILAYVSLRQYLLNLVAQRDVWTEEVVLDLLHDKLTTGYNLTRNFKEFDEKSGESIYREIHIPGPSEILAEAYLIAKCSEKKNVFAPSTSVYSYLFTSERSHEGVFRPYFSGYKERHEAIARACSKFPKHDVVYYDFKNFYPSVRLTLVKKAWEDACKESKLDQRIVLLGNTLINNYEKAQSEREDLSSLLVGPLFCHFLGNLVLQKFDKLMDELLPERYFRYVDDIVIICENSELQDIEKCINKHIDELGVSLNKRKTLSTTPSTWLEGEDDLNESDLISWKTFIGSLKRCLILTPDERTTLQSIFEKKEIRISLHDYSNVSREGPYPKRLSELVALKWFRRKQRSTNAIEQIVSQALHLRQNYYHLFNETIEEYKASTGYPKKRQFHKLRFYLAKLAYISTIEELASISEQISGFSEFQMIAVVFDSVVSRDVSRLMSYGPSAAQAAAQLLKNSEGELVFDSKVNWTEPASVQAYSILRLNGLDVPKISDNIEDPMVLFCDWNEESKSLYKCDDAYFRELGCVHGVDESELNQWALNTPFDENDGLIFDMQSIMKTSY